MGELKIKNRKTSLKYQRRFYYFKKTVFFVTRTKLVFVLPKYPVSESKGLKNNFRQIIGRLLVPFTDLLFTTHILDTFVLQ